MSDILIRGVSHRVRRRLQEFAGKENLSMNQFFLQMIDRAIREKDEKKDEEKRRQEAFRGIRALRETFRRRGGWNEDSAKLIRELRDRRGENW